MTDASGAMLRDARCVLITGAAGFIGSHVACELAQAYPSTRFVGFDVLQPCASIANLADLNKAPNFTFVRGDIVDVDSLAPVFAKYDIDLVMHFAAETSVDKSFVCPDAFARANVLGTVAVLECCRRFRGRIRLLLHVSTDEVYGETPSSIERTRSAPSFHGIAFALPEQRLQSSMKTRRCVQETRTP